MPQNPIYRAFSTVTTAVSSVFWTVYYFFYFLIKGKPEWKCERLREEEQKNCCVESKRNGDHVGHQNGHSNGVNGVSHSVHATHPPKAYSSSSGGIFSRLWGGIKNTANTAWQYVKGAAHWTWNKLCSFGRFLHKIWRYILSLFRPLFGTAVPSKTLPATPKPFTPQSSCDSPSYNKVQFEQFLDARPDEPVSVAPPPPPVPNPRLIAAVRENDGDSFYAEKVYGQDRETTPIATDHREPSMPPPPPPPPPAKPIRIGTSVERDRTPAPAMEKKDLKGAIPSLPADVMAELSGTQRMRQERGASAQREVPHVAQREMTQSCHPDMPEWKQNFEDRYDRSATATPWRASSVGPTMRKLEQVVSRLEDSSDNEAQFVFRPKLTDDAAYRMGRSVFSPVDEAEQMRDHINRNAYDSSRPVTPACSLKSYGEPYHPPESYIPNGGFNQNQRDYEVRRRARTVGPYGREPTVTPAYVPPPFHQSAAYSSAPFTSHTSRRSKTPTASYDRGSNFAYDRDGVTQGAVTSSVRQWPPVSNATGAPVEKDHFFGMIPNDEGLITTMCRRVVERKTEDNWKWRDDHGELVDEKNQQTWKGELDTVLRDGPNQGRHWSRTVEMLPGGDTRFQDVCRQYDNNYVVESVVRNY